VSRAFREHNNIITIKRSPALRLTDYSDHPSCEHPKRDRETNRRRDRPTDTATERDCETEREREREKERESKRQRERERESERGGLLQLFRL